MAHKNATNFLEFLSEIENLEFKILSLENISY